MSGYPHLSEGEMSTEGELSTLMPLNWVNTALGNPGGKDLQINMD